MYSWSYTNENSCYRRWHVVMRQHRVVHTLLGHDEGVPVKCYKNQVKQVSDRIVVVPVLIGKMRQGRQVR